MKLTATDNLREVVAGLDAVETRHAPFATRRTLNRLARECASEGNLEIMRVIDKPLARTMSAVKVFQGATRERPFAVVNVHDGEKGYAIDDPRALAGSKGSIFPNRYLAAQIEGGPRVTKRFESALIKRGVMPPGMQAIYARRSGYLDQFGNLSGARIVQILAYFQAFPEQGYRANLNGAGRDRLMIGRRNRRTGERSFGKGRKFGFSYFVSNGSDGLHPGVWERNYPNGIDGKTFIKPVLLFIKPASYRVRFDFYRVMERTIERELIPTFREEMAKALASAR